MLTLLFIFCMISIFSKVAWLALRGAWGFSKILLSLVFLPIILICMLFSNLLVIALPILLVVGIFSALKEA